MPEEEFSIDISVPPGQRRELLERIKRYYLMLYPQRFKDIRSEVEGGREKIEFTAFDPGGKWEVEGSIAANDKLIVRLIPSSLASSEAMASLRNELMSAVKILEDSFQRLAINLIWVKGEEIVPEEMPRMSRRAVQRLFSSALLLLNVLLFAFNIVLFIFFGFWAVIAILAIQFLFILFSDRLFVRMGRWRITSQNPQVYILTVSISQEEFQRIREKKTDLLSLKSEIYQKTFAQGKEPSCPAISDLLIKYGILCAPESISTKTVDVYDIVREASGLYGEPVPKISVSNSFLPNAAASGVSPKRGALLITGGLLVQLNREEVLSVVGHEMGHLVGRDPLLLYALVSGEFLLRLTLLFPLFLFNPILYLLISTALIFFIAKFFEARADLLSAMVVGKPKVLAESLRKIGYQRLQLEQRSHLRSWLRWDTHPPIYFRIERLEAMSTPVRVEHPLLQSAKDVIAGFRSAF